MSNLLDDLNKIPEVISGILSGKKPGKLKSSEFDLPAPVTLRELEYGDHVADYTSYVLWKRDGGKIHMGCLSSISIFLIGIISCINYFLLPVGTTFLYSTAAAIPIPYIFNYIIRTIMQFQYPMIEIRHLAVSDIHKRLTLERQKDMEKLRTVNLPRLKLTVNAVNTYNKMIKEADVTLRTLKLRGKPVEDMASKLRVKLTQKRESLKKMLNIFGSLVEGETRDIILEETGRTLLSTTIESDEQFSDIDAYISSTIQVLETDIKTLDNFTSLDYLDEPDKLS